MKLPAIRFHRALYSMIATPPNRLIASPRYRAVDGLEVEAQTGVTEETTIQLDAGDGIGAVAEFVPGDPGPMPGERIGLRRQTSSTEYIHVRPHSGFHKLKIVLTPPLPGTPRRPALPRPPGAEWLGRSVSPATSRF